MTAQELARNINRDCVFAIMINSVNVRVFARIIDARFQWGRVDYRLELNQTDKAHCMEPQRFWVSVDKILKVFNPEEV